MVTGRRGPRAWRARSCPRNLLFENLTRRKPADLQATGPGELAGLEALLAEDRTPLCRLQRHRRLATTRRAVGHGLDPLARRHRPRGATGPLPLAGFAPLGFVLEVLVSEELLFSRRPHEL